MASEQGRSNKEPGAPLRASGSVSITMVMNLGRFIRRDDRRSAFWPMRNGGSFRKWRCQSSLDCFDRVRGSVAYTNFLKGLQPERWFVQDEAEAHTETCGHALGVFRQYLINNSFFPTYRLTDSSVLLRETASADPALSTWLDQWVYKIRLTRNGLVMVKLEQSVDNMSCTDISHLVLEIGGSHTPDAHNAGAAGAAAAKIPAQAHLAMDIVARFVEACGERFVVEQPGRQAPITLRLTSDYSLPRLPLHDRHISYCFTQLTCDDRILSAQEVREQHIHDMLGLLEHTMFYEHGNSLYPHYKTSYIDHLCARDRASWDDEICLITSESTLIFCPAARNRTVYMSGSTRTDSQVPYHSYWLSILRGIEHIVTLKNELQLLERETTRLLEKVPDLTRKVTDGHLSRADQREIRELSTGIATLFQALPRQRDMLVSSSVFRAGYAAHKFQYLLELLGVDMIARHTQINVEELNAFLSHYNSIQLQQSGQRTNMTFSILMIAVSVLVLPSFLADSQAIGWIESDAVAMWPTTLSNWLVGILIPLLRLPRGVLLLLMLVLVMSGMTLLVRLLRR